MRATKRKYVVTGSTSDTGRVISEKLLSAGHLVIGISRKTGISMDDRQALTAAFKDADGAYIMIPFDMMAPDLHQREMEIGANLAEALEKNKVPRVVLLSGANAYLKFGSSLGAALMEERLDGLNIPELVHLRCGFFMENFVKGFAFAQQAASGVFCTGFRGDIATPMIATRDIGEIAANILLEEPFAQPLVRELLGPRDYSMVEAMHILGAAIGKSDLQYVQASYEDSLKGLIAAGVSPSFADAVMETARSFNQQQRWALEERSERNTTPTTLEAFASYALKTA